VNVWHWIVEQLTEYGAALVAAVLFIIVTVPIAFVGWNARTAVTLKRRGYRGEQVRRSQRYAVLGVILLVAVDGVLYFIASPLWSLLFAIAVVILGALGWFRIILVPEELAED
jgi:hypothetical protein